MLLATETEIKGKDFYLNDICEVHPNLVEDFSCSHWESLSKYLDFLTAHLVEPHTDVKAKIYCKIDCITNHKNNEKKTLL